MTRGRDPDGGRDRRRLHGGAQTTLSYGGWMTFQWRSVEIEFPDFPGFRPRAPYGAGFNARIKEQLTGHIAARAAAGKPIPQPTPQLEHREGRRVRWFTVNAPAIPRGSEPSD
jgi:hypothetical protein